MIKNHEFLADYISLWTKNYIEQAGMQGVVLGLSGGIDSALVALLCKRQNIPLLCVNMPCHSSSSAYARADAFASDFDLKLLRIDLSKAHETITSQAESAIFVEAPSKAAHAALRSCLRAPTLSYLAHNFKSLIIGTGNRSEDHITRYYQKFGDGCVDFSPISDLFKSEVRDLFRWLATDGDKNPMPAGAQAIYDAKPTADLWGADSGQEDEKELGITYDEIEWADRVDMKYGIIFSEAPPNTFAAWSVYTDRQKYVLETLHRMEKTSRHKHNPALPYCKVRPLTAWID
jgi:NAD+ synthase